MKWMIPLAVFLLAGCTVTVTPLPSKSKTHHHATHKTTTSKKQVKDDSVVVDAEWIHTYKILEEDAGYYHHDDQKIKEEGSKFRVPRTVYNHFLDMTKAQSSPTP